MMNKMIKSRSYKRCIWALLFLANGVFAGSDEIDSSNHASWPRKRENSLNNGESIAQRVKMRRVEKMTSNEVHRYHGESKDVCGATKGDSDIALAMELGTMTDAKTIPSSLSIIDEGEILDDLFVRMMDVDNDDIYQQLPLDVNTVNEQMRQRSSSRTPGLDWDWQTIPDHMHSNDTTLWDPVGDGNCLFWSLLASINEECTISHVICLRHEINDYILHHQTDYLPLLGNYTILQYVEDNLRDITRQHPEIAIQDDPVLQYTQLMEDATPGICEYGTALEASIFALLRGRNVAIYRQHNTTSTNDGYDISMRIQISDDAPTTCLLYHGHHYKLIDRKSPTIVDKQANTSRKEKNRIKLQKYRAKLSEEGLEKEREKARIRMAAVYAREKNKVTWHDKYVKQKQTQQQDEYPIGARCNIDIFDPTVVKPFDCGSYNKMCDYCHALGYEAENKSTKKGEVHFGKLCCNRGKIELDHLPWLHRPEKYNNKTSSDMKEYHAMRNRSRLTKKQLKALEAWEALTDGQRKAAEELYQLFYNNTKEARYFRNNLRKFNAAMSMASLQVTDATLKKGGAAAFKVCGMLYRRVGPMLPSLLPDLHATCTQIYFLDP